MKHIANTIINYILGETREGGTYKFVLPSYPSDLLLKIGSELKEQYDRVFKYKVRFEYGIAYRLGQAWKNSGTISDIVNFNKICEKHWYNDTNNLTSFRNDFKKPQDDCLVVLLAGYEDIDDRASLEDFFHLDQQSIWEICLKKSFYSWVYETLHGIVNPDDSKDDFNKIAVLLKNLYEFGLADALEVSRFLQHQDFTEIMSGRDAYRLVLSDLSPFKLPCMKGLAENYTKSFSKYISPALEFFNYSMLLDNTARKKYLGKVKNYSDALNNGQLEIEDFEDLGEYESITELLDSLQRYIETGAQPERERLQKTDFIFIYEKILGYREKKPEVEVNKKKPKKMSGMPPEVFLRALWITLGDFKAKLKSHSTLVRENLHSVKLRSLLFKHDFEAGEESESAVEDKKLAKSFLNQVLGGIDEFIEEQLYFELGDRYNPDTIYVKSFLSPKRADNVLAYTKTSTAEPSLKFEVVVDSKDGMSVRREFLWALPQNHQCRLAIDLFKWALDGYKKSGNGIPVFTVPYMGELFSARVKEEVNRLLAAALQSNDCHIIDLLKAEGIDETEDIKKLLVDLSIHYQNFLEKIENEGFFSALDHNYDRLRKAFSLVYNNYLENSKESTYGPLLLKAFMIIPNESRAASDWIWNEYLQAAVVTPLHPALLEMIRHQHAYMCESFCYYAKKALEETGEKTFSEKKWDRVVDLSKMQWPVFGTLKNIDRVLDTNVCSHDYIHLIGDYSGNSSFVTSRLLLDYDDSDDDVPDVELFKESRASKLVKQVLLDYRDLYAYADDGISVGAFYGKDIQPVIAGIDAYLENISEKRMDREYSLRLTIFSDSRDDSAISRWVNAWKDRWQAAELSKGKQFYKKCKISISHRVISKDNNYDQFIKLIRNTDLDVMIFSDFIVSVASRFELVEEEYYEHSDYRKFPVLEKTCCRIVGGGKDRKRERVLSNHRFKLGSLHAEVMAHIKNGHIDPAKRHMVISQSDFQPWVGVIDAAHEHFAWVVCIDPAVDEQLLTQVGSDGINARDIIGFGTGVGPHGENNYTISTEQFAMVDIKNKISSQISELLGPWEQSICQNVAESLVREAAFIAGLSVVKATGPSRFVRELIANAMVRRIIPRDAGAFCDEFVSLDAFLHWFDDDIDSRRPDLLRIKANIVDGYFQIEAQIIECKLAQQSEGYLEKARQQIMSGLKQLIMCFRPREDDKPLGLGENNDSGLKPDQRYWWMQLHRLIASKGETNRSKYKDTLIALERLSEGYFTITWQAAAVAFWTDLDNDFFQCSPDWEYSIEGRDTLISVATAGRDFIRRVCLEDAKAEIFPSEKKIKYTFHKTVIEPDPPETPETPETPEEEIESGGQNEEGRSTIEITERIPERILLGGGTAGGRNVYWEFGHPDLPNRHILVFGASGTGKTYTIQALLCELNKSGQNSLIVDYTNGFTSKQLEPIVIEKLNPKQHFIRKEPLAINPFRKQCDFIDDMELEEDPSTTAQRVSGVFTEVYLLGDQQKSALYSAIKEGVSIDANNFNLRGLIKRLDDIQNEEGPSASSAASVISKIRPFVDMNPFGKEDVESWEKLYNDSSSRCHIIQLAGFMKDTARLITEFSLIDLYWYYRARGNKDNPKVIVLDEIQNLDHRLDSPLGQFLTEGRKFGISLILATQTLSNLSKDERDRLFQASHKLFFKPADTEIRPFAQILSDAAGGRVDEWVSRLSSLKRGECYSLGHALNEATKKLEVSKWFKIRISPLDERF